jgi:hypothetical protein
MWIKFRNYQATQVSTEGCQDVYDFLEACKKELSHKLVSYDIDQLFLSTTEGGSPLEPDDPIPAPNTAKTPLLISLREKENHSKRIKTDWEVSKIKQLSYDPSSVLFVLDSNYLANTGLMSWKK